jgi:hypothetical protein
VSIHVQYVLETNISTTPRGIPSLCLPVAPELCAKADLSRRSNAKTDVTKNLDCNFGNYRNFRNFPIFPRNEMIANVANLVISAISLISVAKCT